MFFQQFAQDWKQQDRSVNGHIGVITLFSDRNNSRCFPRNNYNHIIIIMIGLGFYLYGVSYPNGSTVLWTDIGEEAAALQCTTDSTTCCTNAQGETRAGQFYFPDGTQVPVQGNSSSPYYRFRHSMYISLNRRSHIATQPTGEFRCEIPDASGTTVNLFINIGRL